MVNLEGLFTCMLHGCLKVVFLLMKSVTMRVMMIFAMFHLFFSAGTLHHLFPLYQ